jgi:hypothetical protein
LSNVVSAKSQFTAELKETKPGQEFELVITGHPPYPNGNTSGTISINTSLASTPIINVTAMLNVTPAIQVSPSQIILNGQPDRGTTNRVTIVANTTNLLTLSNPMASDSQIQVDLKPGARKGLYFDSGDAARLSPYARAARRSDHRIQSPALSSDPNSDHAVPLAQAVCGLAEESKSASGPESPSKLDRAEPNVHFCHPAGSRDGGGGGGGVRFCRQRTFAARPQAGARLFSQERQPGGFDHSNPCFAN